MAVCTQCSSGTLLCGMQMYSWHERSREHIEWAYEKVVNHSLKMRKKAGFRPSRLKRGERVNFEIEPTWWQRFLDIRDKSQTKATFARQFTGILVAAIWLYAAAPVYQAPLMILTLYCIWRWQHKRRLRSPEGPFMFDSAVLGAVFTTALAMAASWLAANVLTQTLPWFEMGIEPEQVIWFMFAIFTGLLNIFVK